jgi:hypothetical protein
MRNAAMDPPVPGAVAEGLMRLFPLRLQCDEKAMEAVGALVGLIFRGFGFKTQGEE